MVDQSVFFYFQTKHFPVNMKIYIKKRSSFTYTIQPNLYLFYFEPQRWNTFFWTSKSINNFSEFWSIRNHIDLKELHNPSHFYCITIDFWNFLIVFLLQKKTVSYYMFYVWIDRKNWWFISDLWQKKISTNKFD